MLPVLAIAHPPVSTLQRQNAHAQGHVRVLASSAKSHLKYSAKGAQVRKKAPAASRQRLRRWGVISGVVAGTCGEGGRGGSVFYQPVSSTQLEHQTPAVHWQLGLPCCAGVVNAGACCNFASAFLSTGFGGMNPRQHHGELRLGFCIRPCVSLYASLDCQIPAKTQPRGGTGTLSPPAALRARLRR